MEKTKLKSFRDLHVWQKSADLAVVIYKITENFPQSELYGITSQMRRAVISISSNIAEGFKRMHQREKLQFYSVAYASATELESQLEISRKLGFLREESEAMNLVVEVEKMLHGLMSSGSSKARLPGALALVISLYSIFNILNPLAASAATMYFEPSVVSFGVGDSARVEFLLDSPENVNAIEGVISYPADLLDISGINDGSGVFNFWITKPVADQGRIIFAAATPGGYAAMRGRIFTMDLAPKKAGSGELAISAAQALLNDGRGTASSVLFKKVTIRIVTEPTGKRAEELADSYQPEEFLPEIISDSNILDGQKTVIFSTQDKGSGIAYYEVAEGKGFFAPAPFGWVKTVSPHLLADQDLKSWVFVKAVDNKGNERIEVISPINRPWYARPLTIGIVIILLMLGLVVWRRVKPS